MMISHGRRPFIITEDEWEEHKDDPMDVEEDQDEPNSTNPPRRKKKSSAKLSRKPNARTTPPDMTSMRRRAIGMKMTNEWRWTPMLKVRLLKIRRRKREEIRQEEQRLEMEKYPLWARPLKIGCKHVPELGMININPDEGSTRIFDNSMMNIIWRNYPVLEKTHRQSTRGILCGNDLT
jgi:hypothetical protein